MSKVYVIGDLHGNCLPDSRYICVSAERTGLRPIELESLGEMR